MKLNLSVDDVLATTRSVRKRLDLTRPVARKDIEDCLELAFQAPNGSNRNSWKWIVVDDPVVIGKLAAVYKGAMDSYQAAVSESKRHAPPSDVPGIEKIGDSSNYLIDILHKVPAMLIPLMPGRVEGKNVAEQASMWCSITQSVWSFFLALRERGMGSAWTTVTLMREKETADVLGIPFDKYTQVGLFPIAYTVGTDFKKAWRRPVSEVVSYNRF